MEKQGAIVVRKKPFATVVEGGERISWQAGGEAREGE